MPNRPRLSAPKIFGLLAVTVGLIVAWSMTHHTSPTPGPAPVAAASTQPSPPAPTRRPIAVPVAPTVTGTATAPVPATATNAPAPPPVLRYQAPRIRPEPTTAPATVAVVPAPVGAPTPQELSTPTAAVAAWAARWCPFSFHDPLGASEIRAQMAMTPQGWTTFDPHPNPAAQLLWAQTVATGSTAMCSAPQVAISPEAPASQSAAYVGVSLQRVVTPAAGPAHVETVNDLRLVVLREGRWLVDIDAAGAG